jgi:ABC-type sulfate transport system substrate-binding protein
MKPIGVEQGMSLGGDDFDIIHPNPAQLSGDKFRRFHYVAFMFIERADAGDAQKVLEFTQETRLIIAGKIYCGGSHSRLPFWRAGRAYKILRKTVQYT